jgi:CBS domain-containing protein
MYPFIPYREDRTPATEPLLSPLRPIAALDSMRAMRSQEPHQSANDFLETDASEQVRIRDQFSGSSEIDEERLQKTQNRQSTVSSEVLTIPADATLRELAQLLIHANISGVPVVDDQGNVVGVVSHTDVTAHMAQVWARSASTSQARPGTTEDSAQTLVSDIMAPYAYYATEQSTADELVKLMLKHHIHRVLIMRGQQLVGIVTTLDLLRSSLEKINLEDVILPWYQSAS